jgi:hypothetical protein
MMMRSREGNRGGGCKNDWEWLHDSAYRPTKRPPACSLLKLIQIPSGINFFPGLISYWLCHRVGKEGDGSYRNLEVAGGLICVHGLRVWPIMRPAPTLFNTPKTGVAVAPTGPQSTLLVSGGSCNLRVLLLVGGVVIGPCG